MLTSAPIDVINLKGKTPSGEIGFKHPVTFRVNQKEIGVLLGGIGPRQIIQFLMDLSPKEGGRVGFFGKTKDQHMKEDPLHWRFQIGFAFRESGLLANLSLLKNTDLPARYHGYYDTKKSEAILAKKALKSIHVEEKYWHQLPGFVPEEIQKKVLLARASVLNPKILILDDPTSKIPWDQKPAILKWLLQKRKEGAALLVATPDYPAGMAIADWVMRPDKTDVDYAFKDHLDPSWVEVAGILERELL